MTRRMKSVKSVGFLALCVAAAAAVACSNAGSPASPQMPDVAPLDPITNAEGTEPSEGEEPSEPKPISTDGSDAAVAPVSNTHPILPSTVLATLVAAGVEVDVPLHEAMDKAKRVDQLAGNNNQVRAIMSAFTKSLGAQCKDCHAVKEAAIPDSGTLGGDSDPMDGGGAPDSGPDAPRGPRDAGASDGGSSDGGGGDAGPPRIPLDYAKATPMRNLTTRMWDRWVQGLQFKDTNAQVFCDSCHQGKKTFLDRSNNEALSAWMRSNFIAQLENRADETSLKCGSCHGAPFQGEFLAGWKEAP